MDLTKLEEKLSTLTGEDFQNVERAVRASGNYTPSITFSSEFQARIAATALGVLPDEITKLPLKDFNFVIMVVTNFFVTPSDAEKTLSESSDKSQST